MVWPLTVAVKSITTSFALESSIAAAKSALVFRNLMIICDVKEKRRSSVCETSKQGCFTTRKKMTLKTAAYMLGDQN